MKPGRWPGGGGGGGGERAAELRERKLAGEEERRMERVGVVPDGRPGRGMRRWAWRLRAPWELGSEPVDCGSGGDGEWKKRRISDAS